MIALDPQPDASFNTNPTEEEFVVEQALDSYCKAAWLQVDQPNTESYRDDRGMLIRKSAVDDAIQILSQNPYAAG